MTEFEMLLACYRSGQVSERQWQAHLEDKAFSAWVENQNPINCPSACDGGENSERASAEARSDQSPTDDEIRARSTLTMLTIIARQQAHIEALEREMAKARPQTTSAGTDDSGDWDWIERAGR